MAGRPKSSRGGAIASAGPGIGVRHSTEDLLRLASSQLANKRSVGAVGSSLDSKVPPRATTRSSADTYLNNLSRKAAAKKAVLEDDPDLDDIEVSDSDGDGTSTSTLGGGGFVKKSTTPRDKKSKTEALLQSSALDSSDEESRPRRERGGKTKKDKKDSKKASVDRLVLDGGDDLPSEEELLQMSSSSSSALKRADEEYDAFDAESPPKTPVSGRKEVRFSTQLSIASEDLSVVTESVMDTSLDTNRQPGGPADPSLEIDQELGLKVYLGVEDFIPATVKPEKSKAEEIEDDEDDALSNVNNILDIGELTPAEPIMTSTLVAAPRKKAAKRFSSRRRASSDASGDDSDVKEELVESEEESSSADILSIGNLHAPEELHDIIQQTKQQEKAVAAVDSDVPSTNIETDEGSRPDSRVSLYSQDSFEAESETTMGLTDRSDVDFSDAPPVGDGESDVELPVNLRKDTSYDEDSREQRPSSRSSRSSVSSQGDEDSFPTYTNASKSLTQREAVNQEPAKDATQERKSTKSRDEESHAEKTSYSFMHQTETPTDIHRIFHQIVTVQPKPIAPMVVDAETIDSMTNYNPATVALTQFLRAHLNATRVFIDNTRKLHDAHQKTLLPDYHYTTLEETKQYISEKRRPRMTVDEAIDQVQLEMGQIFTPSARQKIKNKIASQQSRSQAVV